MLGHAGHINARLLAALNALATRREHIRVEEIVVRSFRKDFGADKEGLLEALLELLEAYTFEPWKNQLPSGLGHICIVIHRLISEIYQHDGVARVAKYRRAVQYLEVHGHEWASAFHAVADYVERQSQGA